MTKAKTKQASSVRLSIERGLEPHRNRVHTITQEEIEETDWDQLADDLTL